MGVVDPLRPGHGYQRNHRGVEYATGSAHYAGGAGATKLHKFRWGDQRLPAVSLERSIRENMLLSGGDASKNVREVEGSTKTGVTECWVMKTKTDNFCYRQLWLAFVFVFLIGQAPSTFAAAAESWKADWDKTVEAAKKEGQLTLYGSPE